MHRPIPCLAALSLLATHTVLAHGPSDPQPPTSPAEITRLNIPRSCLRRRVSRLRTTGNPRCRRSLPPARLTALHAVSPEAPTVTGSTHGRHNSQTVTSW